MERFNIKPLRYRKVDRGGHICDAITNGLFRITLETILRRRAETQAETVGKIMGSVLVRQLRCRET